MPPGTAVFETISSETYEGIVHSPMYNISPMVVASGVIQYEVEGTSSKLLFGDKDFKARLDSITYSFIFLPRTISCDTLSQPNVFLLSV